MDSPEEIQVQPDSYVERLVARLSADGDRPCFRQAGLDVPAAAFLASIFRHARALAGLGIGRGDLVALLAPNRLEAVAIRYAANLIGAGTTYLSAPRAEAARARMLAVLDPALLVAFPQTRHLVPSQATVRLAAAGGPVPDASLRLDELADRQPADPVPCLARPDDLAVVISSGGSTGVPKGSWRTFRAYGAMVDVPSPPDRRQLINGRLAYLSQALVDITLLGGGTVVFDEGYDAARTLALIQAERITDLFLVEPQLFELMDHPDVPRTDLSSLRTLTHIGASAPPTLRRRARDRLGPVIAHTYGASEEGLVSSLPPAGHDPALPGRFTSAGRVHPGVELRLRRPDGSLAAPGEAGSIEIRSPAMANGYYHRPDLEAAAFHDGWYRPGDLGRLDGDGHLHILGRAVDIAWVGGRMVGPTLIEDTLCRQPSVRCAVVVADAGSWIAAALCWPGTAIDTASCLRAIRAEHGAETADGTLILPLDAVPLTEQGKPDREAIKTLGRLRRDQPGAAKGSKAT